MEQIQENQEGLNKLNLGCGFRKMPGMINVDITAAMGADVVCDLSQEKWPWPDNSAGEVYFEYSLEQMGEGKKDLYHVIKELYRVCANDAKVFIKYAHPRHDQFFLNPVNVHRLSPQFFQLLSVGGNMQLMANGSEETFLAFILNVDFSVARVKFLLSPQIADDKKEEELNPQEEQALRMRMHFENNICRAVEVDLTVHKRTDEKRRN
jgi:predicted SAM-dependent methyltransferase